MKAISFILSGRTAFFKKPDVNSYAYYTYNNIHKIAVLGILGGIIGLRGYNQMEAEDIYPEFYKELKDLKISIRPQSNKGYFQKKIQIFNNSVGYASMERGGNLIVREQWLEDPRWEIVILDDNSIDSNIFERLREYLLDGKCEFIPYLGKNDHFANIDDVKVIDLQEIKEPSYINSLFPFNKIKLDDDLTYDDKNPFMLKEVLPIRLNKDYNYYEFMETGFTNLEITEGFEVENTYQHSDLNYYFI